MATRFKKEDWLRNGIDISQIQIEKISEYKGKGKAAKKKFDALFAGSEFVHWDKAFVDNTSLLGWFLDGYISFCDWDYEDVGNPFSRDAWANYCTIWLKPQMEKYNKIREVNQEG